jgi:hypothetical protein
MEPPFCQPRQLIFLGEIGQSPWHSPTVRMSFFLSAAAWHDSCSFLD